MFCVIFCRSTPWSVYRVLPSFTEFGSIAVAVTLMTRTYLPSFTGFSLLGATVNEFSLDDSGFFVVVVV